MPKFTPFLWGLAVGLIAVLNILEVLPDWTTITAVLTLPFVACATGMRCALAKSRSQ